MSIIAWPICWSLYWFGDLVSRIIDLMPDADSWENPAHALYLAYQWSMQASCRMQDRYDVKRGPWGDWQESSALKGEGEG